MGACKVVLTKQNMSAVYATEERKKIGGEKEKETSPTNRSGWSFYGE